MAQKQTANSSQTAPDFFIPNMCNAPALTLVVISAEMFAVMVTLLDATPGWEDFAIISLFLQWCSLGSAMALCLCRRWLVQLPGVLAASAAWLLVVIIIGILAVLGELVISGILNEWLHEYPGIEPWLPGRPPNWPHVLNMVAVGAISAGMVMRYLYIQQNLRTREQADLQLQLQALQSRIRPHFLFNSMNIITSLIETDPEKAGQAVENLSALFRAAFRETEILTPLQTEIDLCARYIYIEQLRMEERLQVEWDLDPIPETVMIPPLTLQPLIENAIYHGIQPLPEGGRICIKVRITNQVSIWVENPRPPPNAATQKFTTGNQLALENIRSRLSVLHGVQAKVACDASHEQFLTCLSYPVSAMTDTPAGIAATARRGYENPRS